MAKKPAAKPEAAKAAPATSSPAASEEHTSAGPSRVAPGSEGGIGAEASASAPDPGAPSPEGAPGNDDPQAPSTEAPPAGSAAGGQGEDARDTEVRLFAGDAEADLADAVFDVVSISGLTVEGLGALSDDARNRLASMIMAARAMFDATVERIQTAAVALLAEGDLFDIEARSRDGKPFRRAGFVLGDAWRPISVTAAQLDVLAADRGIQIRKPI